MIDCPARRRAGRGAEKIASAWADNRKVAQIVFKPDWTRHGKAKRLGIPLLDHRR